MYESCIGNNAQSLEKWITVNIAKMQLNYICLKYCAIKINLLKFPTKKLYEFKKKVVCLAWNFIIYLLNALEKQVKFEKPQDYPRNNCLAGYSAGRKTKFADISTPYIGDPRKSQSGLSTPD